MNTNQTSLLDFPVIPSKVIDFLDFVLEKARIVARLVSLFYAMGMGLVVGLMFAAIRHHEKFAISITVICLIVFVYAWMSSLSEATNGDVSGDGRVQTLLEYTRRGLLGPLTERLNLIAWMTEDGIYLSNKNFMPWSRYKNVVVTSNSAGHYLLELHVPDTDVWVSRVRMRFIAMALALLFQTVEVVLNTRWFGFSDASLALAFITFMMTMQLGLHAATMAYTYRFRNKKLGTWCDLMVEVHAGCGDKDWMTGYLSDKIKHCDNGLDLSK